MTIDEAIKEAKQQLSQAIYNSENLNNNGLAAIYSKKSDLLSALINEIESQNRDLSLYQSAIKQQQSEIKQTEMRALESFIRNMPKTYRKRTENWAVVKNILQAGGQTSCVEKCRELGIDPYGYTLERVTDDETNV